MPVETDATIDAPPTITETLDAVEHLRTTARTLARQLRASRAREFETQRALADASWQAYLWRPSDLLGNEPA